MLVILIVTNISTHFVSDIYQHHFSLDFHFQKFKALMGFEHHLIWYGILELFYIQTWTENLILRYIRWVTCRKVTIVITIFKNALINGTDGSVEWMPPGIFRTKCTIDIKSWGFRHLSVPISVLNFDVGAR